MRRGYENAVFKGVVMNKHIVVLAGLAMWVAGTVCGAETYPVKRSEFSRLLPAQTLSDSAAIIRILLETRLELMTAKCYYEAQTQALDRQMAQVTPVLEEAMQEGHRLRKRHLRAMLQKAALQDKQRLLNENYQVILAVTRYRKGLDLIKLLYEKILGLDHHFSALQTQQNVLLLSNPNTFPEFQEYRSAVEERLKRKNALKLPGVMEGNPFLSAAFSLIASVVGDGQPAQKTKELERMSCILDFTLRMSNDLHLIYYETAFLKDLNQTLKKDCIALFGDYTKPIGYYTPLDLCRKSDDWENVNQSLTKFGARMENLSTTNSEKAKQDLSRAHADLSFPVDRLLDFINQYAQFVSQGEKYYQKFQVIVNNYANETLCTGQLPPQFADLKRDIALSIEKFNESYYISELKGSKLKDLLYGNPD